MHVSLDGRGELTLKLYRQIRDKIAGFGACIASTYLAHRFR